MEVPNPRRVLAVSLESQAAHLSAFIKELTGQVPSPAGPESSLAGTTHDLSLTTRYYRATVPVWLDLVAAAAQDEGKGADAAAAQVLDPAESRTTAAADWAASFLSEEAREVLAVLGAVVIVFAVPPLRAPAATIAASPETATTTTEPTKAGATSGKEREERGPSPNELGSAGPDAAQQVKELIHHVGRVLGDGLGGWEWDGVRIAVGVGGPSPATGGGIDDGYGAAGEWDEVCADAGMEFVHVPSWAAASAPGDRNEFGEKSGMERVREALEANDWEGDGDGTGGMDEFGAFEGSGGGAGADDDEADEAALDPENLDFGFDRADFEGLKRAIWSAGGEHGEEEEEEEAVVAAADDTSAQTKDGRAQASLPLPGQDTEVDADEREALDDDDVARVERMMRKLQAAREAGQGMNEAQRKKMAARAVAEVMRDL
ncbi:hypothetical protein PLIIFM63780_008834 [Purpureocillium lilacinum]|nr:hypothetical protein PLIIFM63780_008834 [Purpureocillium lilacinum]